MVRTCLAAALVVLGLLVALPASAITLEQARSQGLIGETARGYVAPVKPASPDVTQLVNQVNAGRRAEYQKISQRTGSTLDQVEALAAQKLFGQLPSGTYIQGIDGRWARK